MASKVPPEMETPVTASKANHVSALPRALKSEGATMVPLISNVTPLLLQLWPLNLRAVFTKNCPLGTVMVEEPVEPQAEFQADKNAFDESVFPSGLAPRVVTSMVEAPDAGSAIVKSNIVRVMAMITGNDATVNMFLIFFGFGGKRRLGVWGGGCQFES